jgi:hypothetical protein
MNRIVLNFKDFILNEKNKEEFSPLLLRINEDVSNSDFANLEEWIKEYLPDRIRKHNTKDEYLINKVVANSQNLIKDASKIFSSDETSSSLWQWIIGGIALIGIGAYAIKKGKLEGLKKFGNKFIDWFKKESVDVTDDVVSQSKSAITPKVAKLGKRQLQRREKLALKLIETQNNNKFDDAVIEYVKKTGLLPQEIQPTPQLQEELSFFVKNKRAFLSTLGLTSLGIIAANHKSILKSLSSQNPEDEDLRRMDALVSNPDTLLEVYKSRLEQSSSFDENMNDIFNETELKKLKADNYKIGYIISWHIASLMVEYNSKLVASSLHRAIDYSIKETINQTQQG